MKSLAFPVYEFLPDEKRNRYRLREPFSFQTGIKGHGVFRHPGAVLLEDGTLLLSPGFRWDLGTGALDTPAMVVASAAHDALCEMINAGRLPRSRQDDADRHFRRVLREYSSSWFDRQWRWVRWLAVRAYQVAKRWRRG